jgi:hypothetical protein
MNCNDIERLLLLRHSGEIRPDEAEALERHLSGCDACRKHDAELRALFGLAADSLPDDGPSRAVMENIDTYAGRRIARKAPVLWFPRPVVRAVAYAAVLAIIVGVWSVVRLGDEPVLRIEKMHALVLAVSESDGHENSAATGTEGLGVSEDAEALKALAQQLLLMEGFLTEDDSEGDYIIPLEALPSTDPPEHSRSALPQRRYV